jgi:hypothetical protein
LQAAAGDPDATVESLAQQINASSAALTASLAPVAPASPAAQSAQGNVKAGS